MAPLPKKTIQNFIHRHPLKEVWASTKFLCDSCRTPGSGTRYRCEPCDFDLHLHCANSPEPKETIKHFLHRHPLTKYSSGRRGFHCDGCGTPVTGTWYRCEQCDFDLHRDCADSPEEVSFVLHPHPLRLTPFMPRHYCNLCRASIVGLFYRCERCDFDLHLQCYHELFAELKKGPTKLRDQKEVVDALKGYSTEFKEQIERSYEEKLMRITEMVESKLKETTARLEQQLAEEQAARLKAEEMAQLAQMKSNDEIRKLRENLVRAQKETEELKQAARCTIL